MSYQTWLYEKIARPLLFSIDPETTHDIALLFGRLLGSNPVTTWIISLFFSYENKTLKQTVNGIVFQNPVGLAAGFDKNAVLTGILPSVGFGFVEVGSITAKPCLGNKKPRLFRLPKDKSVIVNYGLANEGANIIAQRLKNKSCIIPLGVSIAKTNDRTICGDESISDYYESYQKLKNVGDYITINISCPNAGDGRSFEDAGLLEKLLKRIGKPKKPVFLKISPDISENNLDEIIALAKKYAIAGFIISNLTHDRTKLKTSKSEYEGKSGGISGKPVQKKSLELVRYVYSKTKGKFTIIAVGGIFTADDTYQAIRNGASLVQLITGMLYRGPGLIKEINKGLVKLIKEDGYAHISEARGTNA